MYMATSATESIAIISNASYFCKKHAAAMLMGIVYVKATSSLTTHRFFVALCNSAAGHFIGALLRYIIPTTVQAKSTHPVAL